jgi:LDH2 family malate/lactate/ureidoglycolate dehydrogenase
LIHGDPERKAYQIRIKEGIPVNKEVVASLEDIAGYTGINLSKV